MALAIIPVDQIEVEQRLRPLSAAQVESLSSSIAEVGLLNPITVYARQVFRDGNYVDGFGLVAGAHRLEAIRQLGLVEVAAQVVTLSDLERQIAECDENLCSTVLSKAERALFTRRRQDAYEALHPETRNGTNQHSSLRQVGEPSDRFTADTAAKTGQSERAVQRDAERGKKVIGEVINLIRGTALDTGAYLDKLKGQTPNDQVKAAKRDLANLRAQERDRKSGGGIRFKPKVEPIDEEEAKENQVRALMAAWNKAGREAREEFLARIDTSVMDRSAA